MRVLKLLYEERGITASGHETTDTDPGAATTKDDYSLESYILGTNHYQIELLANLDRVPEAGALVGINFPKVENGTWVPPRGIAWVPWKRDTLAAFYKAGNKSTNGHICTEFHQ